MTTALRPLSLDGCAVLAVTAHPDDETLAFGGTLARCAASGGAVSLLCLTSGELGRTGRVPAPAGAEDLGARRRGELGAAAAVLGLRDLRVLDFPDGRLRELEPAGLVAAVAECLARVRPEVVLTFGEDGLYWHPDHTTVHDVTVQAVGAWPGPRPALHHAVLPAGLMRAIADAAVGGDSRAAGVSFWGISPDAFGLHARPPAEVVDVTPFVERKLVALRCHESQMRTDQVFARLSRADAERLLGQEYFYPFLESPR